MGANTLTVNAPVVDQSDVVFVAVKPGVVPIVLEDVKSHASGKLFISVAMGVTIKQLEKVSVCGCGFPSQSRAVLVSMLALSILESPQRFPGNSCDAKHASARQSGMYGIRARYIGHRCGLSINPKPITIDWHV